MGCWVRNYKVMDKIEEFLEDVFYGKPLEDETCEIVDFSLKDQIEELVSKGIESSVLSDYKPVVKKSVSYIVAGVLINEANEVLLMQEAKSSCAGSWYLPAGRVEPGEDFREAVKREVLEETGLEFEPTTLLMIESAQGHWFRFVFTGKVTGGELKTVSRADSESLQANWVQDITQMSLRCKDIIALVERARAYHNNDGEVWHDAIMPAARQHGKLLLRFVTMIRKKSNNRIHVLVSEHESAHLPTCEIHPQRSIHSTIKKFMQSVFGAELPPHKPHGVLSIEHCSMSEDDSDGICLTVLVSCRTGLEDLQLAARYTWLEVSSSLGNALLSKMGKNMTLLLNVIK